MQESRHQPVCRGHRRAALTLSPPRGNGPAMIADDFDIRLGASVKARREGLRITQAEMGGAIGVTFQQVQKYERGTNRIAASTLGRIARALNTSASELMGETIQSGDPDARAMLIEWAKLTRDQRQAMLRLARAITQAPSV